MSQWSFVLAAYGLTALATVGLIGWAFAALRRAEAAADAVARRR